MSGMLIHSSDRHKARQKRCHTQTNHTQLGGPGYASVGPSQPLQWLVPCLRLALCPGVSVHTPTLHDKSRGLISDTLLFSVLTRPMPLQFLPSAYSPRVMACPTLPYTNTSSGTKKCMKRMTRTGRAWLPGRRFGRPAAPMVAARGIRPRVPADEQTGAWAGACAGGVWPPSSWPAVFPGSGFLEDGRPLPTFAWMPSWTRPSSSLSTTRGRACLLCPRRAT